MVTPHGPSVATETKQSPDAIVSVTQTARTRYSLSPLLS
jgi:hypothetical protein